MNGRFHPAAEAEFLEATGFYEQRVQGLGSAFIDELETTLALICEQPTQWPVEASPGIRRVVMQRFPFSVLYRVVDQQVFVLAVAHHRRRPQYWLVRA